MHRIETKKQIYRIFSDTNMIILAVIAIIAFLLELSGISQFYVSALNAVSWIVWLAFLLEFALKVWIEQDKTLYIVAHKLDSVISLVIILTPITAIMFNTLLPPSSALRLVRIVGALRNSTVVSGGAYAAKAGVKSNKKLR